MLMITSFTNPRMAQAFVDYMATQGVTLTIQQRQYSDVWLADERHIVQVQTELARFMANPNAPRYLAASWQSGNTHSGLRYAHFSFFAALRDNAGPFTWLILVSCVVIFVLQNVIDHSAVMLLLTWPADSSQGLQLWRYFTHAFIHFSLIHLLFNLVWWWYLGGMIEKHLGSGKLIRITVVSALISGLVQYLCYGLWFGGLSGVVYALMGYAWLRSESDPDSGISLSHSLVILSLFWLVTGFLDILGMAVANGSHIAGLLTGVVMAWRDT